MTDSSQFGDTFRVLGNAMDLMEKRQKVISSNIANKDTPGYSAARLEFEQELQNRISESGTRQVATNPKHFPDGGGFSPVQGSVERDHSAAQIGDENSVNLDQEMLDLSENQIRFEAASQILRQRFALIQYVLQR